MRQRVQLASEGKGAVMSSGQEYKDKAANALKEFYRNDMRWSYWIIGGLIAIAIVASFFKGGWQLYPFLFAAGVLSMIHEAADRNGQGVPPLYAYAFLLGGIGIWILVVLIFSFVNPFILFLGVLAL